MKIQNENSKSYFTSTTTFAGCLRHTTKMNACMCVYLVMIFKGLQSPSLHARIYIHTYTYMYLPTYVRACINLYLSTCGVVTFPTCHAMGVVNACLREPLTQRCAKP